ncbi:Myosin heavy chain-related protein [Rhynchospora pubera]|uniref:Myosin heavy chain-related protein n=1 Tax=Rhynchospora pubera TaxID=906938 RepID=A0AAV8HSV1_9POAL|nr:Myosin heavy chain-related protein [Rhynchospora pubera]KAJ4817968.1 Myosin heavy chain-related protein [Rhynchospora pubera]
MQKSSSRIRSGGGGGGVEKAKTNNNNNNKRPCAEVSPNLLLSKFKFNNNNAIAMPPVSSHFPDPKPVKATGRSPSKPTPSPFHEKRASRIAEMQLQINELQEELKREREEKTKANEELAETKKKLSLSLSTPPPPISLKDSMDQVEIWEREIERAKESERNMLESLIFQTKQLEQAKISVEEAKLEIRSLKDREEEVETLKLRVRSAVESEEKSKKAIDDLATALNDVSEEAKQVKTWLSETESELVKAKSELEAATVSLKKTEERLKLELDEIERLKFEKEESAVAWNEKEKLFVSCMKESESEINRGKQENLKLIESQRVIREENARLREMLKQAVNEAASLKETLEAERDENSRLKESISEKEQAFQTVKQDFECLKISERSARDSLKELENMLDSNPTPSKSPAKNPCPKIDEEREEEESNDPKPQPIRDRRHSIGAPSKFNRFSESERFDPFVGSTRKDRVFASLSNIADMKAASRAVVQELGEEYDYIDQAYLVDEDQHAKHKKKPILRRFGDIFKRKSVGY